MAKKIRLIVGIIAVIVVFLLGALYFVNLPENGKSCVKVNNELQNYVLAQKTENTEYCQKTGNPDFCIAHVTGNTGFCDTFSARDYCLAIITNNPELCDTEDYWCKADASKDIKYCDELPANEKSRCIADINLDAEYYEQDLC